MQKRAKPSKEYLEQVKTNIETTTEYTIYSIGRDRIKAHLKLKSDRQAKNLLEDLRDEFKREEKKIQNGKAVKYEEIAIEHEHSLKRENRELRQRLENVLESKERDKDYEHFIGFASAYALKHIDPPSWMYKSKKLGARSATPIAMLSDTHCDEVIDPAQVNYVNGYNRKIALERVEIFFRNTIELTKDYLSGMNYEGLVMPMGGDIFSGNIHDELKQTNEDTTSGSIVFWLDPFIAGIRMLADNFGNVFIPVVVGNHPRNTHKPINKMRVRDNFDWLFAQLLAREFSGDKRVVFKISESPDCNFEVYNKRFLLTHGDQFKGGSGISGLLSPMMIGNARKRDRQQAINSPYDYLMMGHWHQMINAMGVYVNGSVKGYDEYAFNSNFKFELPKQMLLIADPKWGVTITAPIHVMGANEEWAKGR